MIDIKILEESIHNLLETESTSLIDLRNLLLEIEESINSPEYQNLSTEEQNLLQDSRKSLKSHITRIEAQQTSFPKIPGTEIHVPEDEEQVSKKRSTSPRSMKERNPLAEEQMEDAEKLFYGGRYVEAIKLFDRVLKLEPNWERARQHRAESENYLRTGYIPTVALPAEAASAFGKAQSATRVGRYTDAMNLINKAQGILRDLGIQRWQEGLEFEQKLQENIDAENSYEEGLQFFGQGKIDEAIERIEAAGRVTGLPKYTEKAQQFRRVKEIIRTIQENLGAINVDARMVTQAKVDLDMLALEYGENPAFQRLRLRLETTIPRAVAPLKEQIRSLKAQADRSTTIEETQFMARQAKTQLDQIRSLEGLDENLDHLQTEVDRLLREVAGYENDLGKANASYESNRRWPSQAARLSREARQRFPGDPNVIRLNRSLSTYHATLNLINFLLVLLILIVIGLFGWWSVGRIKAYLFSLTPTPTFTTTPTFTGTFTYTPTSTSTITPTATATHTPTSTPIVGSALRDIWARSGCYEGFSAIGRIPTGGTLNFLPTERRFDQFNRECLLVEYLGEGRSTIGWVLIEDIGSFEATPTP